MLLYSMPSSGTRDFSMRTRGPALSVSVGRVNVCDDLCVTSLKVFQMAWRSRELHFSMPPQEQATLSAKPSSHLISSHLVSSHLIPAEAADVSLCMWSLCCSARCFGGLHRSDWCWVGWTLLTKGDVVYRIQPLWVLTSVSCAYPHPPH